MYDFTAPFGNPSGSPIRELFKYQREPGMISFAGGYPASDLFDVAGLQRATERAWQSPVACLQYGPTDGIAELKAELKRLMHQRQAICSDDELLVTTGSQQGFDLLLRIFVNPGDVVVTEEPAYPATLQALRLAQAEVVTVPVDADGIDVARLTEMLESGLVRAPKLLYTVPTFANPTGGTLSRDRRIALLKLAVTYRFVIIEDDPYGDLRFSGAAIPSMLALSAEVEGARQWLVHFASLSKIVAPGLRIGWIVAPKDIVRRCIVAKQTMDLCSAPLTQLIAAEYLRDDALSRHLPVLIDTYRAKCQALCSAMASAFGDAMAFHPPAGGLFVWATVKEVEASALLKHALERKVMFVPGPAFYVREADAYALRLSFAAPPIGDIAEGVARLKSAYLVARDTRQ